MTADLCPPTGIPRPIVTTHDDGTIELELWDSEHRTVATFHGTPIGILRDYLAPLQAAVVTQCWTAPPDTSLPPPDGSVDEPALDSLALFAAGWLTAHPAHALRHQMTLDDAMHDRSLNAKFINYLEANVPKLNPGWRP